MLTNVLLVDDHPMFRKGLRMLLETEKDIRVVGEAGDGQAAVEQVRVLSPDVVIMDISMPSLNGIEATRQILSGSPKTKVAALSIHGGKQFVKDMLGAGASAYILKDSVPEELINGIRKVMRNEVYLSDAITDVVITGFMDGGAADESTAILGSKLTRPATTSARLVDRPLFISRLEEGLKGRVTLISAPAGYGKTTLAAQWLGRSRRLSAWLSLDKRESEPERFLRYVVSAIRNAVPGFGSAIWPLLSCAHLSPPGDLADAMISDLAVLKEPLLLVVDDYQTIVSEPVQAVLLRMVEHLPDSLHLVILTRVDPPWPLARWRARQWLNEFRAGDLRFSKEETQLLLGQYAKTPLASETVDMLCSRTEGWVAALQLVRLSLAEDKNPDQFARNFSESDRLAIDYLMEEVFSQQPPEIQDFLAVTAMFDRFCAPLCETLLGDRKRAPHTRRTISRLEAENLFLVPLDRERRWYRYHHLFQKLLIHHSKEYLSSKRKAQVQSRAGKWFAGQGLIEEALNHFLAAGEVDNAAGLLEKNLHAVLNEDLSRRTLGRWLNMFPKSAEEARPALLVAQAYREMFHWDMKSMAPLLDRAEAMLRAPACEIHEARRQSLLGDIDVQRAFYFYWQGEAEDSLRHAQQALQTIPKEHSFAHTLALRYAALSHALSGRRKEALHLLAEAVTDDCSRGSRNAGILLATRTGIYCYAADLKAVEETAKQLLAVHEIVPVPDFWRGYAHYFLGSVAYERNLLDTADDHFGRVRQMRYRVDSRLYQDVLIGLALVAWARGDAGKAEKYAASARSFAIEIGDPYSAQISESFKTRMALLCGEIPAEPPAHSPKADSHQFWLEVPSLTHAEYLLSKGSPGSGGAARDAIQDGLQRAQQHHNDRQAIQFLAVKAVALKYAGRLNEALQVLEETLCMAEPLGFVRTFLDRGPVMADLLKRLLRKNPENLCIKSLLDAFGDKSLSGRPTPVPSEDNHLSQTEQPADESISGILSNREIDVLLMLEERLSNKEIAERLFVSPETVKKHTANIYLKLNVSGRRQAVSAGRKLGLLPQK